MNDTLAVVLGGGAGTRLFPLTGHRAKPAVPLAGKYRLVDVPISNCLNSGLDRIFVLTQFNSASLNRHVAQAYRFDRFGGGFVTILAAEQTRSSKHWYQGTADAVRQSLPHIDSHAHEHVIILSGDQLYSMDYRAMLAHHRAHNADITIATIPVVAADAPGFGILKTDENHAITEFHEKPPHDQLEGKESPVSEEMAAAGRVYLASMGIYLFNADTLHDVLDADEDAHDFGYSMIPRAIGERNVVSYPFEGYWSDIGTVRSFFDANIMLTQPEPPYSLYDPAMPLYTNARMLAPAKVEHATVRNAIISEGSVVVGAEVSDSVIGIRSFVGAGAVVRDTVMMGADYYPWSTRGTGQSPQGPAQPGIGERAHVENTIIDRNASIGADCRILNSEGVEEGEGEGFYIRDGIVVVAKNAEIPPGTTI